jgi:hypothetical protein
MPGRREGQEKEPRQEGEGRVNHDTAPLTKIKGITRLKVRQAQPTYWVQNKQNDKMHHENA